MSSKKLCPPGGRPAVGPDFVEEEKQQQKNAAAAAAEDLELPPPQPTYVKRTIGGRDAYLTKDSHILVEGVGQVRLADFFKEGNPEAKKEIAESIARAVAAAAPPAPPSEPEAQPQPAALQADQIDDMRRMLEDAARKAGLTLSQGDGVYTARNGQQVDLNIPIVPESIENYIEEAVENVRDVALAAGPDATDKLVENAEVALVENGTRAGFLERRVQSGFQKHQSINGKIATGEQLVLSAPVVKQHVDVVQGIHHKTKAAAAFAKPKETKILCNLM